MKNSKKRVPDEDASALDRLALWITERVGTMFFFVLIFLWTASWLLWNMYGPKHLRFDPFPGFVFWLFISNMIQLFLMPLIMIGQNLQSRVADQRAENDYEVNCKAEVEIQEVKAKLDYMLKHFKIEPPTVKIEEPPEVAPVATAKADS